MKKQLKANTNNPNQENKTEQLAEKTIFSELYQVRKFNNLVHKLTFFIQRNKELVTEHSSQSPQMKWEIDYLCKELERIKVADQR